MLPPSTYVIGDVHGCARTLAALLAAMPFMPHRDHLWLVGDLVNRGPDSAGVLRWAMRMEGLLGERFACVLGNHDVHCLARVAGLAAAKKRDTLDDLLAAPDRDELAAWLRHRPLLHRRGATVLVHAGLLPEWTVERAEAIARETEAALATDDGLLARYAAAALAGRAWRDELPAPERLDLALSAFILLRTVDPDGVPLADFAGSPAEAPPGATPWFLVPGRRSAGATVVCGHWAAMGLRIAAGLRALDTGCVWGGRLTALRLDDGELFQVENRDTLPAAP